MMASLNYVTLAVLENSKKEVAMVPVEDLAALLLSAVRF